MYKEANRMSPELLTLYTTKSYILLTPLKPHFYIVKLGFTGVYIIFLISAQNIDCGSICSKLNELVS